MFMLTKAGRVLLLAALFLAVAGTANADSVVGVPVAGTSLPTTQAVPTCPAVSCFNPTTGAITFFIPLSASNGGVFGVTPHPGGAAGTFSDTGSGALGSLTMYLMFSPVNMPVSSASLSFVFTDLDLSGGNDPSWFFESVQFLDANGNAITPLITAMNQSGSSPYLEFQITGGTGSQTISFPDVTSILNDPFFVQLTFGSATQPTATGKNTPETLIATLNYTSGSVPDPQPESVPEPASLVLLSTGLLGIGFSRRRK